MQRISFKLDTHLYFDLPEKQSQSNSSEPSKQSILPSQISKKKIAEKF